MVSITICTIIASVMIGIDKGGIPGLGALGMALVLTEATSIGNAIGPVLAVFAPVLMTADAGAIFAYWKDVNFSIVFQMSFSILIGMTFGFLCLGNQDEKLIKRITGGSLLLLAGMFCLSKCFPSRLRSKHLLPHSHDEDIKPGLVISARSSKFLSSGFLVIVGIVTGALTVVANVAGPIVAVYFIQLELSKRSLNGTRAIVFLFINFIKIPAQMYIGNFSFSDVYVVVPLSVIGLCSTFMTEHFLMPHINQHMFENASWFLVSAGALKLLSS